LLDKLLFDFSFFFNQFILFLLSKNRILLCVFNVLQGSINVFCIVMGTLFKIFNTLSIFILYLAMSIFHDQFVSADFVHFSFVIIFQAKDLSIIISEVIMMNILFFKLQKRNSDLSLIFDKASFL